VGSENEKTELEEKRAEHQKRADAARQLMRMRERETETDESLLGFTYDLQKTQPIPYLNTNRAYYSRQLSLFNLGIHRLNDKKAFMCVWHEAEGKRGSAEVASCIYEFLKINSMQNIRKIHSFSDSCGGQNRNRNIIAFKMWCCSHFNIDEWEHTYMESGHSFLPNDQNFGKIEQAKKRCREIFTMEDWIDVIGTAQRKNPFHVIPMREKFVNVNALTASRKFAIKNDDGNKFSFLNMKWFLVNKNSDIFHYKNSNCMTDAKMSIKFVSTSSADLSLMNYDLCISEDKRRDLQSLMAYIPNYKHSFFENLKVENRTEEDDIDVQ